MLTATRTRLSLLPALVLLCLAAAAPAVTVDIGEGTGNVGDTVSVPVMVDDLTGLDVHAFELRMHWYLGYAELTGVSLTGTLAESWGGAVPNGGDGQAVISAAGVTPLSGAGTLIQLEFLLLSPRSSLTLTLDEAIFNEGDPPAETENGVLHITTLPTINISPNSGEILVGESLDFNTSGGTEPYVYTSGDPAVATFMDDLLTGIAPGSVRAHVADDAGAVDSTSGFIDVRAFRLSLFDGSGSPGDVVTVPVIITDPTPYDVTSAEFALTYNESRLTAIGASIQYTVAGVAGWSPPALNFGDGRIDITMAGANPLSMPGAIALVEFLVDDAGYGGNVAITPTDAIFNESYTAIGVSGMIVVSVLPDITVYPNTGLIVAGDQLLFYVSGGATSPLSWGVTDPAVASIDGGGLLTALDSGETRVFVQDFLGLVDTTDVIRVCDLYLSAPRDTLSPDLPTLVPIFADRAFDGLGIHGYELVMEFNGQKVDALGASSVGCASEAWGAPVVNALDDRIIVVHAGSEPLSGALPLIRLELQATIDLYGSNSGLEFTEILFNEGDPCALTIDGLLELPTGATELPAEALPRLWQNYPNPFNPSTRIEYALPGPGWVRISIHDLAGLRVRRLLEVRHDQAGRHVVEWDGRDDRGRRLPSGVYFTFMEAEETQLRRKLVLLK